MGDVIVGSVLKKAENGWKMPIVPTSLSKSKKIMGACQTYVPNFVKKVQIEGKLENPLGDHTDRSLQGKFNV